MFSITNKHLLLFFMHKWILQKWKNCHCFLSVKRSHTNHVQQMIKSSNYCYQVITICTTVTAVSASAFVSLRFKKVCMCFFLLYQSFNIGNTYSPVELDVRKKLIRNSVTVYASKYSVHVCRSSHASKSSLLASPLPCCYYWTGGVLKVQDCRENLCSSGHVCSLTS